MLRKIFLVFSFLLHLMSLCVFVFLIDLIFSCALLFFDSNFDVFVCLAFIAFVFVICFFVVSFLIAFWCVLFYFGLMLCDAFLDLLRGSLLHYACMYFTDVFSFFFMSRRVVFCVMCCAGFVVHSVEFLLFVWLCLLIVFLVRFFLVSV